MAADDSDYGEELDWDDEELETQLTAIETAPARPASATRIARVEVEVEGADQAGESSEQPEEVSRRGKSTTDALEVLEVGSSAAHPPPSLWERFRKRRGWGGLSVSDLVGPSWCEVQHSYRLSSKSHLPPEERPATIVTSTGATIPLNQKRTVAREVVLDKGRAVHKVLEKEAMGDAEEIKVVVGQKEEWWALRILNTIVCLETLIATGLAREIPVAGFVGPFLVFGVIDEIDRRELPPIASTSTLPPRLSTPKKGPPPILKPSTPTKKGEDTNQRKLEQFFSPSPTKKGEEKAVDQDASNEETEVPAPRWGFVLSDSKTRYNRSLPPKNESRASRLQLMLYHRLLSSLLAPISSQTSPAAPSPFDWPRLFAHLSLDPSTPFTAAFLTSIHPVLVGSSLEATLGSAKTLAEFIAPLQRYGETLGAQEGVRGPFEEDLEINYRLRNNVRKWKPRKKSRKELEEEDLKRAIAESLRAEASREDVATAGEDEEDLARALAMSLADHTLDQDVKKVVELDGDNPVEAAGDAVMETLDAEVEAIPYIADVSLLVPPSNIDTLDLTSAPSSPSAATDLPSNSQAAPPSELRYNLRRRRPTTSASENIDPNSPLTSPSTPSSKRLRPAPPPLSPSKPPTPPAPQAESSTPPPSPPEEILEGSLIGTERFKNDPKELDSWLRDVTSLWMGEREPRGVSLEQTSRCRTCEFEEGCEWRQTKALEALEATRARNRALAEGKKV
ncbi:exonuclease V a 5' deoxyribonuclease-domain-containing protein [Leucosporidium creatinivorum]|uniref:Exonuclease V a 5' deoxyribonuclease-domain-containing protein n=1 Tax=Leucosporidium creatinivorum TaxID=106004 RepID=A0A1Y2G303_9BASI|nr:exonuclease V a 5' deoxyribonuclease-domain-containing protein [Leucosporidium creatinivorum]